MLYYKRNSNTQFNRIMHLHHLVLCRRFLGNLSFCPRNHVRLLFPQVKGIGGPKLVPCEEDTDFLNDFQKLMVDDYQSRRTENVKVPSFDVAVPMQLGKKKAGNEQGNRVNFMVMLKKGSRQQLRDLKVPITSDLAANIREKQQEEQAEQEEVKRLVLDYNQRQEEETYNGREMLSCKSF